MRFANVGAVVIESVDPAARTVADGGDWCAAAVRYCSACRPQRRVRSDRRPQAAAAEVPARLRLVHAEKPGEPRGS